MDRREVSRVFRARLSEAMMRADTSQATLARRVGVSRSTLAQLLSADAYRLPRADTVAAVATELKVSLDWLLGLSQVDKLGADPYSIYGRVRLALYVGQIHLVFNTAEHISVLNRQFDDLVRAAVVHSNEVGPYLRGLLPRIREHG